MIKESLRFLPAHMEGCFDLGDDLPPGLPHGHRGFGQRAIPQQQADL
jgi:hypothetical protein